MSSPPTQKPRSGQETVLGEVVLSAAGVPSTVAGPLHEDPSKVYETVAWLLSWPSATQNDGDEHDTLYRDSFPSPTVVGVHCPADFVVAGGEAALEVVPAPLLEPGEGADVCDDVPHPAPTKATTTAAHTTHWRVPPRLWRLGCERRVSLSLARRIARQHTHHVVAGFGRHVGRRAATRSQGDGTDGKRRQRSVRHGWAGRAARPKRGAERCKRIPGEIECADAPSRAAGPKAGKD